MAEWTNSQLIMMHLLNWTLVVTRLYAFLQGAPFFGSNSINPIIKGFIPAILAVLIYMTADIVLITVVPTWMNMVYLLVVETFIGVILAYFSQLVYFPLRMMGMMVGRSSGFGRGFVIDPDTEDRATILQQFILILGILMFFTLDGHHMIIKAAVMTFQWIPLGGLVMNPDIVLVITNYFGLAFNMGIGWAAPIMGCILIGTFCFGILGKSMPQMNLLIIDLPVRIAVGLMGIAIAIPYIIVLFQKFIGYTAKVYKILIMLMGGA